MNPDPIRIAVAGAGSRGADCYGRALLTMPEAARVVAVAEPRKDRRENMAAAHQIPPENCFETAEEMLAGPRIADALFVCTQDRQHVRHALAGLEKGYDILLEKPISPDLEELQSLVKAQKKSGKTVVVCHVLRYAPFFREIHKIITSGVIGDVVTVRALENVLYWHQAHSFVRGNWRNQEQSSPMLLQKCCHDLDYLVWLTGKKCERVSSFGSLRLFRKECAPEGSAKRCLDGCRIKDHCPYDAEKIYLTNPETGVLAGNTDWPCNVLHLNPNEENIRKAIQEGPYGRCVYHCDNDVVDHQVVNMEMEGGATLNLTMCAFTALGGRNIEVLGTLGEIRGQTEQNEIHLQIFGQPEKVIDITALNNDFSGHAGGDIVLLKQFLGLLRGEKADSSISTLEASVESHLIALAAEESRLQNGKSMEISPLRAWND